MAIAFVRSTSISRKKGQSVVASASYRSCEKLHDDLNNKDHDYSRKKGWEAGAVLLPDSVNMSKQDLWNLVEQTETRCDARLAKEYIVALPKELSKEENAKLANDIAKLFAEEKKEDGTVQQYPVQWDMHSPHISAVIDDNGDFVFDENGKKIIEDNNNIHCHILVCERFWDKEHNSFSKLKDRNRNSKEWLAEKKLKIGELINSLLREKKLPEVDFRAWEERNKESIEKTGKELAKPQEHKGVKKTNIERKRRHRKARIRNNIQRTERKLKEIDKKKNQGSSGTTIKAPLKKENWNKEITKKVEQNVSKNRAPVINITNTSVKIASHNSAPKGFVLPNIKVNTSSSNTSTAQLNMRKSRCAMCGIEEKPECKKCHFYYDDLKNQEESESQDYGHGR